LVWELEEKKPTTEASGRLKVQDLKNICERKENPKDLVLVSLKRRRLKGCNDVGVKCCCREDR